MKRLPFSGCVAAIGLVFAFAFSALAQGDAVVAVLDHCGDASRPAEAPIRDCESVIAAKGLDDVEVAFAYLDLGLAILAQDADRSRAPGKSLCAGRVLRSGVDRRRVERRGRDGLETVAGQPSNQARQSTAPPQGAMISAVYNLRGVPSDRQREKQAPYLDMMANKVLMAAAHIAQKLGMEETVSEFERTIVEVPRNWTF
jgi:hypothetical protein